MPDNPVGRAGNNRTGSNPAPGANTTTKVKRPKVDGEVLGGYMFSPSTMIFSKQHIGHAAFRLGHSSARDKMRYYWEAGFQGAQTRFKILPNTSIEGGGVNGTQMMFTLGLGKQPLKAGRISAFVPTLLIGGGENKIPQTTREIRGEKVTLPAYSAKALVMGTRFDLINVDILSWLSAGATVMLAVVDPEGTTMDQAILGLGFNVKFRFPFTKGREIDLKTNQKPSQLFFITSLFELGHRVGFGQLMGSLNDKNETLMNAGLISPTGGLTQNALTYMVALQLVSPILSMRSQATSVDNFIRLRDWRSWVYAGAEGVMGAINMFFDSAARRTSGVSVLANVAKMAVLSGLRNPSLSAKKRLLWTKWGLFSVSVFNMIGNVIGVSMLGVGKDNSTTRALTHGLTINTGSNAFMSPPGVSTSMQLGYGAGYLWSKGNKDNSGWVGTFTVGKDFENTWMGARVTALSPLLAGDELIRMAKPGEAQDRPGVMSMILTSVGFSLGNKVKYFKLYAGPETGIVLGGAGFRIASLGAVLRTGVMFNIYKKIQIGAMATVRVMYTTGNTKITAEKNSGMEVDESAKDKFGSLSVFGGAEFVLRW